jgi:hypothetical protein
MECKCLMRVTDLCRGGVSQLNGGKSADLFQERTKC